MMELLKAYLIIATIHLGGHLETAQNMAVYATWPGDNILKEEVRMKNPTPELQNIYASAGFDAQGKFVSQNNDKITRKAYGIYTLLYMSLANYDTKTLSKNSGSWIYPAFALTALSNLADAKLNITMQMAHATPVVMFTFPF